MDVGGVDPAHLEGLIESRDCPAELILENDELLDDGNGKIDGQEESFHRVKNLLGLEECALTQSLDCVRSVHVMPGEFALQMPE